MLTPEQGKVRLEAFRVSDPGARATTALKALGQPARAVGEELLGLLTPNRYSAWARDPGRVTAVGVRMDSLAEDQREALCAALLPDLGAEVAAAWVALRAWPYQTGATRRMFRAPGAPEVSVRSRVAWLLDLYLAVRDYRGDAVWLARWVGHLPSWTVGTTAGTLLACVLDRGGRTGDAVFAVLRASTDGSDDVAVFGRHVIRALLSASRAAGWEIVEHLLLRAQREEGLRQVILETIDEAHPEAFRRMLGLVVEHRLARFSAVARAVDVWFGFAWDSDQARRIEGIAARVLAWLPDRARRRAMLADVTASAEDIYLALWCDGQEDAVAAVDLARPALRNGAVEVRYAAAYFLRELDHAFARAALADALSDPDLRVVDLALGAFMVAADCQPEQPVLFERIEALVARWPARPSAGEVIVWPWCRHDLDPTRLGRALSTTVGDRPLARLRPHIGRMDVETRRDLCRRATAVASAADTRVLLTALLGDASPLVRHAAFAGFSHLPVDAADAPYLESLLSRRADDLRRAVIEQLLRLPAAALQQSVERLLVARSAPARAAGVELLRRLAGDDRLHPWARERAAALATDAAPAGVQGARAAFAAKDTPPATLDDALGLSPPADRTPVPDPVARKIVRESRAAAQLLLALDEFVVRHASTPCPQTHGEDVPLGALRWWNVVRGDREASRQKLPAREAFEPFWRDRARDTRDHDRLEVLRAFLLLRREPDRRTGVLAALGRALGGVSVPTLRQRDQVEMYVQWMLFLELPPGGIDFALDVVEASYAALSDAGWQQMARYLDRVADIQEAARATRRAESLATTLANEWKEAWSPAQRVRWWHLHRARHARQPASEVDLDLWLEMYEAGVATDADFAAVLLRPLHRVRTEQYFCGDSHRELAEVSGRARRGHGPLPPRTVALVERVRARVLEIELARGETPTPATEPSLALRCSGGLDVLARVSHALVGASLRRGSAAYLSDRVGREATLSHILRGTRPGADDTLDRFALALPVGSVGEVRLLEIAVFAPQWAGHVERALGWTGLAEAVWWMHAHTKDTRWTVEEELREAWQAQTSERTPLSGPDLLDGAVDVAWFVRVRAALGDARFGQLLDLAKYASSGTGHTRAKLFASALLGTAERAALLAGVVTRRHQDSLRALGLLPLADGVDRAADLLERYLAIQEFVRGARKFGSQRQASEKRAAAIGMENLARTAGYRDPARLEWAMERAALGDLAQGPVTASAGEVVVALSLDADGAVDLVVCKKGKALKAVPAAAKKEPAIRALLERAKGIELQRQRMRASLEAAMIGGDEFVGAELRQLLEHPVLAPQLARLVLIGPQLCGYPSDGGRALRSHDGTALPVAADARLRIAHPHDLLEGGRWSQWQRDCLRREVVQPFKQVFRELYVLTAAELEDGLRSRRYAGHQLQPRQAMALLGARGWIWHAEEGVRKVDHQAGIAAWIEFQNLASTPGEVEGLTLESVAFTRRGEWEILPLPSIPPRLLSETLRDVDLVVSVASRSGVDPEASTSTLAARAALVVETCALVGLGNVRVDGRLVLIDGALARYSVHLGSASVHRLPGGHVCIIAVGAAHRGRVFLPFADDDPRTAEILSKVLLLARDEQIKDPTILEQLRR